MGRGGPRRAPEDPSASEPPGKPSESAGVGPRAAAVADRRADIPPLPHRARHQDRSRQGARAPRSAASDGSGRLSRSTAQFAARSRSRAAAAKRKTASSSRSGAGSRSGFGLPGARQGVARSLERGGQHGGDRRARHPKYLPRRHHDAEAARAAQLAGREAGATYRSSPSIRPMPKITTMRCTRSRHRSGQWAHVLHRVADVAPGGGSLARSRGASARLALLPSLRRRSALRDLCCARAKRRRWRCYRDLDGRGVTTFHRALRPAAKHHQQAQGAMDGGRRHRPPASVLPLALPTAIAR
jgi:hypothetical protein